MMDLRQLEYFVRVAESGSFTKAAALLRVAQPALSRQIRHLEETLRVQLLTRNGRGVVATEAGRRLLVQSRGILRQVARAREEIEEMRGAMTGRAAIGMPKTVSTSLAVPLVTRFRQALPNVELTVLEGRSSQLQEWISSGRADLAVMYEAPFSPLVENVLLATENLVLVSPIGGPSSPVTVTDLPAYPLLLPSQPNTQRMLVEAQLARHGQKPQIACEIDSVPAILELVRDGHGHAVLTRRSVRSSAAADALTMRLLVDPMLEVRLFLSIPTRPTTAVQEEAIALVRDLCRTIWSDSVSAPAVVG
jgi:LysR family nitrogen assimilation transcriptional regulator